MARAQSLSTSQSDTAFPHIYSSAPQEANSYESVSLTTSSTLPDITSPLSPPSSMETSTSIDSIDAQSTSPFTSDINGVNLPDLDNATLNAAQISDVDPQILEALKSKDRIYVLKLGEMFEALIKERRARAELSPATSYQRLLVHRCSAYYKLVPESDPMTKGIFVLYTTESRIPERRISELVPAESTTQPAFKIMRRSATERRSKPQSQTGSIAGDEADLSDLEPSESGSQGGRSNATGGSSKKRMTIEEREAAYNKARSRIFNKFEELGKEKDMSASSSSLSGSTSNSANTDDQGSPATAESDWSATSGPRDKKDNRRGNSGNGIAPHSRSIRSGASFNGSGSSRNSRAPSPSFSYATLYEPPPSGPMYDPSQHPHQNAGYYPNQTMYSFPSSGQGPTHPPFTPVYPCYAPYGAYQSPLPHPQYNLSDPPASSASEPFSPPHQMNYGNYYGWSHHPNQPSIQSPPHTLHHPPPSHQYPNHLNGPPPPQTPPFQTFIPQSQPLPYPYPVNGQYAPSPGPYLTMPPHTNMQQQQPSYENPRPMNGNTMGHQPDFHLNHGGGSGSGLRNGLGNGVISLNSNGRVPVARGPSVVSHGNGVNGTKSRPPIPPQTRTAWSYGPGVGMGGFIASNGIAAGDAIGPRLSSNHRRPSGNSNSSNSLASSICDENSSTASSSTSSSSRRTYTSTTSSQHPLPARPDWAVGLKAQPTLAGRLHEQQHSLTNSRTMSPISPPWSNGNLLPHHNNLTPQASHQQEQQTPPTSFQSTDFPPLSSAQEKRAPVVSGAWGLSRPSLSPTNGTGSVNGSVNGGTAHNSPISRLDEAEGGGGERPVGKIGELYNPKVVRQLPNGGGHNSQSHHRSSSDKVKDVIPVKNGEVVANANNANANLPPRTNASLVVAVSSMSLGENGIEPSSSISTFRVGIEQEPTVTATST